jgi:hypothetical protein
MEAVHYFGEYQRCAFSCAKQAAFFLVGRWGVIFISCFYLGGDFLP